MNKKHNIIIIRNIEDKDHKYLVDLLIERIKLQKNFEIEETGIDDGGVVGKIKSIKPPVERAIKGDISCPIAGC